MSPAGLSGTFKGASVTIFIMGHGQYKPPDTFVPKGTSVGVYANVDTTLAITLGMAVLSTPGGYASVTTYASTNETIARINNYRVDALSHPEYQKMYTVQSKNDIIYIGYTTGFDSPSYLCGGTEQTCHDGVHQCDGILARVKDPDIRLAFCIVPTSKIGISPMTTEFPATGEYAKPRGDLEKWRAEALRWLDKMKRDPAAIDEFHRFAAKTPNSSQEAAFILASSKELDDFLLVADARKQRDVLSPPGFLNYLQGLPPEAQKTVGDALKKEGGGRGAWNKDDPGGKSPDVVSFISSFFSWDFQARYAAWTRLTDEQREQAQENLHVAYWGNYVVPVIRYYTELAVHDDQPLSSFRGILYETGLPGEMEIAAHETAGYKKCQDTCMTFAEKATPQQKLVLWDRLGPEGQRFLRTLTGQGPEVWKMAPAVQAAATPDEKKPDPVEEERLRQEAEDERRAKWEEWSREFWDEYEVKAVNSEVAKGLADNAIVTVLQVGERFKFVKKTPELVTAFPGGRWGTFKACDSGMDDVSLKPDGDVGVDIAAFRVYLGQLSDDMMNFALKYKE